MVRLSAQPSSLNRCTNAATFALQAEAVAAPSNPMVGNLLGCCARAASGHAATAPPNRLTNSRRLMPGMGSLPGAAAYHSRSEPPSAGGLTHQGAYSRRTAAPWDGPELF